MEGEGNRQIGICLNDELWIREKVVCGKTCDKVGMSKEGKDIGIVLLLKLRMWERKGKLELALVIFEHWHIVM